MVRGGWQPRHRQLAAAGGAPGAAQAMGCQATKTKGGAAHEGLSIKLRGTEAGLVADTSIAEVRGAVGVDVALLACKNKPRKVH